MRNTRTSNVVRRSGAALLVASAMLAAAGCRQSLRDADREVAIAIAERQRTVLGASRAVELSAAQPRDAHPDRTAYARNPGLTSAGVPSGFEPPPPSASQPATTTSLATRALGHSASLRPMKRRGELFSLTDALAYAQEHKRDYQTAQEDLYLGALALTLERHLWTPQFAANLRTVYGNFGEITDFDQAMRFVADLSLTQRLPYGGEFTAAAISTLIRDVKHTATVSEGSQVELTLRVPFLRGAGHVSQEDLIQLERDLTYAVRSFERFRRRQLVDVAQAYFNLLRAKQRVIDDEKSLENFRQDYARAVALEEAGTGTLLDTLRAEERLLTAENGVADQRESFRSQSDDFKLLLGMPVDDALWLDDLEDIDSIERQIERGKYPLLLRPTAVDDQEYAVRVAIERRLDLLNRHDQIDDAKRGVAIARNAMLPDLDWNSSLTFDSDPEHYRLGGFEVARANWRSEILLSLPLERIRERNRQRTALIDVRRAQRQCEEAVERVRAEVRRAVNAIYLEERSVEIQQRNLQGAERRREFARLQFYDGLISNRDLIEAEDNWTNARNRLNLAKTARWNALLQLRLATETLLIDESGVQHADPDLE
ncbi:MAG: TolC family protein [Planctomycetes bacterium]|nr:TolC family protein [Planctomycetota bacterium]